MDLLLGQVSKGDRASGGRGTKKGLLHEIYDFVQQPHSFFIERSVHDKRYVEAFAWSMQSTI